MTDPRDIMSRSQRLIRALPDAFIALPYLMIWIHPDSLGGDAFEWLENVLFAQIGMVGLIAFMTYKLDIRSLLGLVVSTIVAAASVIAIAVSSESVGAAVGMLFPLLMLLYSLYSLAYSEMPTVQRRMQSAYSFYSVVCLSAAVMVSVTLPLPKFGWASVEASPAMLALYGSDPRTHAHWMLALGFLYFSSLSLLKYLWRPSWAVPRFKLRRRIGAP